MSLPRRAPRLASLDILRGLTVFGMIVVNTPGNDRGWAFLDHAPWDGCTLADLVFPFFLFVMGAAMAFTGPKPAGKVVKRAAVLFGLGLLLNAIPHWHPGTLRLLGVLQRIAFCYAAVAGLDAVLGAPAELGAIVALLIGYAALLRFGGDLSAAGNLGAKLDRAVLGAHIYRGGVYDPEGLLSTLPSIATTLIGLVCGRGLQTQRPPEEKAAVLALIGFLLAASGWAWGRWLPVNKALWTSSYALFTAGLAAFALADLYWLADFKGRRGWAAPFEALGVNAIAAYVLPILLLKAIVYPRVAGVQPRLWLCAKLFEGWLSASAASAAFAFSYAALWAGLFLLLKRRGVTVRI
jgi:predicted acyltransferase